MDGILDGFAGMGEKQREKILRILIEEYLPWFLIDTGIFQNAKIRELDFCGQRHFISVLAMKRAGNLDKPYRSMRALDSLVQHTLEISAIACKRLKEKLQTLDLIDEKWQPLGWERWQYDSAKRMKGAQSSIMRAREAQQERNRPMTDAERAQTYRKRKKQPDETVTPRHETVTPQRDETGEIVTRKKERDIYADKSYFANSSRNFSLHRHKQEQTQGQKQEQEHGMCMEKGVQGEKPPAPENVADAAPENAATLPPALSAAASPSQSAAPPAARPAALPPHPDEFFPAAGDDLIFSGDEDSEKTETAQPPESARACEADGGNAPQAASGSGRPRKAGGKKSKPESAPPQKPDDVDLQVWNDFLILRKSKKAPVTMTVLNSISREARIAGISLQEALQTCCEAGWQGFQAVWYENRVRAHGRQIAGIALNAGNAGNAGNAANFTPIRPRYMTAAERLEAHNKKVIEDLLKDDKTIDGDVIDISGREFAPSQADNLQYASRI